MTAAMGSKSRSRCGRGGPDSLACCRGTALFRTGHLLARVGGDKAGYDSEDHFWLFWPLQVHRMRGVPLVVPACSASRHSPAWTLRIDPSACLVHFWLFWPLQGQMMTRVPLGDPDRSTEARADAHG
ncbi:hypothetical protein ADK36_37570 [Streptomyces viridochromogenes]|nr:hypothetical protein ADK36_37570 [Streptomyces viridochromogenes]